MRQVDAYTNHFHHYILASVHVPSPGVGRTCRSQAWVIRIDKLRLYQLSQPVSQPLTTYCLARF